LVYMLADMADNDPNLWSPEQMTNPRDRSVWLPLLSYDAER
jgi:hypothetical protein